MLDRNELSDALGRLSDDILEETDRARRPGREGTARSPRQLGRTAVALLAAATLLTLGVLGAVTTYSRWHMPAEGETYHGNIIETTQVTHYPVPSESMASGEGELIGDEWFMAQAAAVLTAVNKEDTEATQLKLTRQTNQQWNREEVVVSYVDGLRGDVTFDAQHGYLIHVTAWDREISQGGIPMSDADALAIAQGYYDALPYARGYEFQHVEKFDDNAWMFLFGKPIQVELWGETMTLLSAYEQVRITIDPCVGTFQLSNCFYVPLLDDHAPEDQPLTQEEALAIVFERFPNLKDYDLVSAKVTVCLPTPGWPGTSFGGEETGETPDADWTETNETGEAGDMLNLRAYHLTRLGWELKLEYQPEDSPFLSGDRVCVDLYTGEILSWDISK